MAAERGGVLPGDEPAAARGADRSVREGAGEASTLCGEGVEVWREGVLVPIAAEVRRNVLAHQPDDVGLRRGTGGKAGHENQSGTSHERISEPSGEAIITSLALSCD